MPIYEYRCSSCGADHEVLQKLSDPLLVTCPSCHKDALVKQLSAAGFQLKGSGWYVTDFRNGSKPAAKPDEKAGAKADDKPAAADGAKTEAAKNDSAKSDGAAKPAEAKADSKSEASTPAPAATKPTGTA
jgi:putative FmdB family regulatory protein